VIHRISFQNYGLIDVRAISTFGAHVKEGANPIGFFGTGLKYALAVCLRLGCTVTLYRGLERYDFVATPLEIRGKTFEVVTMRDETGERELGFTTELGKTWEAWQAFRELYCNTLDEGGRVSAETLEPLAGHTTFHVDGEPIYKAYSERAKIVLEGEPDHRMATVHVHAQPADYAYFRGVRIHRLPKTAALTYNLFGHVELTEDRTAKFGFLVDASLRDCLLATTDEDLLRAVLTAPAGSYESTLDFDTFAEPGPAFVKVLESLPFARITNPSALVAYKKHHRKAVQPDPTPLNEIEVEVLRRATAAAQWMGYTVEQFPVVVTTDLPENTWGMAYNDCIWLNRSAFQHGTKVVTGTLIEEFLHLAHGLKDESRALQNNLLNALVSMAERARGAPL
jgi:hypothetical protein